MIAPNLGWVYYKDLYNEERIERVVVDNQTENVRFDFDFLKEKEKTKRKPVTGQIALLKKRGEAIFERKFSEYRSEEINTIDETIQTIDLTTSYPGLLCGSGYSHGILSESDFKLGFFFDHTSGLPVIPGSSVKGVLRSVFPGCLKEKDREKLSKNEIEERYLFFKWIIRETNKNIADPSIKIPEFTNPQIDLLESFIFEGTEKAQQISYYLRDIILGAYLFEVSGHGQRFLKNDYITPHINREHPEMSSFTNPIPIQFLKVLPSVKFRFQFHLKDGGGLLKEQKRFLFREILNLQGVGAKTNVGYGHFENPEHLPKKHRQTDNDSILKNPVGTGPGMKKNNLPDSQPPKKVEIPPEKPLESIRPLDKVLGIVQSNLNGFLNFNINVKGIYKVKPVKYGSSEDYKLGSRAILEVASKQTERGQIVITLRNPKFLSDV
jgi:CRISPR-associated protein Cmr6